MNTNGKRGRGRPRGTGLNDAPMLERIADMMVRTPGLPATTALRQIEPDVHPSTKRRIQAKWKVQGERLIAAARLRLTTPREIAMLARSESNGGIDCARRAFDEAIGIGAPEPLTAAQLALVEVARRASESIEMATARAVMGSPAMQAIQRLHSSPVMQAMRELQNSPTMRALHDLQNSPTMRAMWELQNSPAMRAVHELQNSPAMRAMREAQAMLVGMRS